MSFIFILVFLAGCALLAPNGGGNQPFGTLAGRVSVGPLSPVERVDQTPVPPAPEVYTTRGLEIYLSDGKTLWKSLHFEKDGTYQIELPAGEYIVNLLKTGIDHSRELPTTITIQAGEITRLEITIDTGIR